MHMQTLTCGSVYTHSGIYIYLAKFSYENSMGSNFSKNAMVGHPLDDLSAVILFSYLNSPFMRDQEVSKTKKFHIMTICKEQITLFTKGKRMITFNTRGKVSKPLDNFIPLFKISSISIIMSISVSRRGFFYQNWQYQVFIDCFGSHYIDNISIAGLDGQYQHRP